MCQVNHKAGVRGPGSGDCRKGMRGGMGRGPRGVSALGANLLLRLGRGGGFEGFYSLCELGKGVLDLLKVQRIRGGSLGRGWGFILLQGIFDEGVVEKGFKVGFHN